MPKKGKEKALKSPEAARKPATEPLPQVWLPNQVRERWPDHVVPARCTVRGWGWSDVTLLLCCTMYYIQYCTIVRNTGTYNALWGV